MLTDLEEGGKRPHNGLRLAQWKDQSSLTLHSMYVMLPLPRIEATVGQSDPTPEPPCRDLSYVRKLGFSSRPVLRVGSSGSDLRDTLSFLKFFQM